MSYDEHLISMAGGDGDALDLDAIQARADAATEGPWISVRHDLTLYVEAESRELNPINVGYVGNRPEPDANFIAHARTDVPALLALVREQQARIGRVTALHVRDVLAVHEGYGEEAWCPRCRVHWPCPTIAALTATEGA